MRGIKYAIVAGIAALGLTVTAPQASAQVGVEIGVAPVCPYGYYDVAPYACAPAGYYGPEWFSDGVFVGAGPWFHGPDHFRGYVDNRFHPEHGYHGDMPHVGDRAPSGWHVDSHFRGNEMRDGRGHVMHDKR